ncbi:MAG: hypothetical protein C4295_00870 [Candidatus Fervidibacterota bacterium]
MYRLKSILLEREALLTIGIFGLAQMLADVLSDASYNDTAMVVRFAGIALVLAVLITSWLQKPSPLCIPLLRIEENKKGDARARYRAFVKQIKLEPSVRAYRQGLSGERRGALHSHGSYYTRFFGA